ncbi:MAG: RNA methyltransferase [Bacteroidota bacterium]|nr:RNA methyltransferase [Bacteroidota bacterium]
MAMLNKATQKWIRSLEQKKYRQELGLFLAEGNKLTEDLLSLLPCRLLVATQAWSAAHEQIKVNERIVTDQETLNHLSLLKHPQEVLGVFEIPDYSIQPQDLNGKISLALDNIQDPGNLGTILRIADWFGIDQVICSIGTADAFNPKTVQATMGAIGRIKLCYTDLCSFLSQTTLPIFGTFLEGKIIYDCPLPAEGIIVMGNEGNGISAEVASLVTEKLFIPDFPAGKSGSESLNVSVATAIVCSEFRRRAYGQTSNSRV